MPTTDLQHFVELFRDALDALGLRTSNLQLERWSILVHNSMSGSEREYHGVQHVFDVTDGLGPVATLAGLFHDTVYVLAEGYLRRHHTSMFAGIMDKDGAECTLRPYDPSADRQRSLVEAVFGVGPGSVLSPRNGLSEFLSALLAVRTLGELLPDELLVQVAAGIEATIPFRGVDQEGLTTPERLHKRLLEARERFSLQLDDDQLVDAVHSAVELLNRDLAGFGFEDTSRFLDYTWLLLPESVMALRGKNTYNFGHYRVALQKMTGFFAFLTAEKVFCQFRGVPGQAELDKLSSAASLNIARAHGYLKTKLAAITCIYAVSVMTGGDAPVALFMGDLPGSGRGKLRLEELLPKPGPLGDCDPFVYALLIEGRRNETGFDIKNSPLAAYLYTHVGPDGIDQLADNREHPLDPESAARLLETLPVDVRKKIFTASAQIATTRTEALLELAENAA